MKTKMLMTISVLGAVFVSISLHAQTVSPGKQTIDKTEYLGLNLNQNIPEKYLSNYWSSYLEKFGKVKGKRSTYTIDKASIPSISTAPVQLISQVSSSKDQSQVFMALNVGGQYIANYSDETYKNAETVLKDFSSYAGLREEVRVADESFITSEKSFQKLTKENDNTAKDIEKTEKKLAELRSELVKKKQEADNSLIDLQNKQKALEVVKGRLPVQK